MCKYIKYDAFKIPYFITGGIQLPGETSGPILRKSPKIKARNEKPLCLPTYRFLRKLHLRFTLHNAR